MSLLVRHLKILDCVSSLTLVSQSSMPAVQRQHVRSLLNCVHRLTMFLWENNKITGNNLFSLNVKFAIFLSSLLPNITFVV